MFNVDLTEKSFYCATLNKFYTHTFFESVIPLIGIYLKILFQMKGRYLWMRVFSRGLFIWVQRAEFDLLMSFYASKISSPKIAEIIGSILCTRPDVFWALMLFSILFLKFYQQSGENSS